MTVTDQIIDYMRALITRDFPRVQLLGTELAKADHSAWVQGVSAAFINAVDTQFNEDTDVREIASFVKNLRARFQDGENINARLAEAVIRTSLGETGLLDDVTRNEILDAELTIIYAMMNGSSPDELEEYLKETRELLEEEA